MNSRICPYLVLWPLALLVSSLSSIAHQGNTSFLTLIVEEDRIMGRWDIPLADLDLALQLDEDKDHKVGLPELQKRFDDMKTFALRYVKLTLDGAPATILVTNISPTIQLSGDGASTALEFTITNVPRPRILEMEYRFMFDQKPLNRAMVQVNCRGTIQTAVFNADRPVQRFNLEVPSASRQFFSFGWHGVWHIWIGLDHILFLLALLLPSVLRFENSQWRAVSSFREAFVNVFKVVTAFTLAHSLTLSVAALQIMTLPSRWVESAIAGSVLLAAVNNIRVFFTGRVWVVAFIFGLIHGFGFANVLTELGLPRNALLLALVGFNVGVEVGQLAIVTLFLPVAFGLRRSRFYQSIVMKLGSILIGALAMLWLVERAFDWEILPI